MQTVITLTFTELGNQLRALGVKMSNEKLRSIIEDTPVLDGVVHKLQGFKGQKDRYFILKKDFDRWVEQYAEEISPAADIMQYVEQESEG